MRIQIIAEGPTDRKILRALLKKIDHSAKLNIIEESKTQRKKRGKYSILRDYKTFAKFLHNGYSKGVDVILIHVDNDDEPLQQPGIDLKTETALRGFVETFQKENGGRYASLNPCFVFAIPVRTTDYWMRVVSESSSDCIQIRKTEQISRSMIKEKTYGKSNVLLTGAIKREAIASKIQEIETKPGVLDRLRCLRSFSRFEEQLAICVGAD